jgi:hypothetical protein
VVSIDLHIDLILNCVETFGQKSEFLTDHIKDFEFLNKNLHLILYICLHDSETLHRFVDLLHVIVEGIEDDLNLCVCFECLSLCLFEKADFRSFGA